MIGSSDFCRADRHELSASCSPPRCCLTAPKRSRSGSTSPASSGRLTDAQTGYSCVLCIQSPMVNCSRMHARPFVLRGRKHFFPRSSQVHLVQGRLCSLSLLDESIPDRYRMVRCHRWWRLSQLPAIVVEDNLPARFTGQYPDRTSQGCQCRSIYRGIRL